MTFKRIIPLLLFFPLLLLIVLVLASPKQATRPSVRLVDGTIITLEAVTYGNAPSYIHGKSYQKLLHRMLPAKIKHWSGCSVQTYTTFNTNSPRFWITYKPQPEDYSTVTVIDEYGSEYDPNGSSMGFSVLSSGSGSKPTLLTYYQIDTRPPHGKIVGLCLYSSQSKTQKLAQFLIPGATLTSMPATNSSLPLAKTGGDLTFEFKSLTTGLRAAPDSYSIITNANKIFSQARLRITGKSGLSRGWTAENIKLIGKNGKTSWPRTQSIGFDGNDLLVNFEKDLDSSSPCKLEIQFAKYSGFSDDKKVVFKEVKFPPDGQINSLSLITNTLERTLTVKAVHAANSPRPSWPFQPAQPVIEVSLTPASSEDNLLLIDVLNEQGKPVSQAGYAPMGKGSYLFGFQRNVSAKTIDLTFTLHRKLSFEFEVTPVRFRETNYITAR